MLRGAPATAADRVAVLLEDGHRLDGVLSPDDAMSAAIADVLEESGCEVVRAPDPAPETPEPSPTGEDAPSPEAGAPGVEGEPEAADELADPPCRVALTGGGTSRDGARAMLAGEQSAAVYEDPRELARIVAAMVSEVVRGIEPAVTLGAVTDNGARDVPTLLLEPVLLDRESARRLVE